MACHRAFSVLHCTQDDIGRSQQQRSTLAHHSPQKPARLRVLHGSRLFSKFSSQAPLMPAEEFVACMQDFPRASNLPTTLFQIPGISRNTPHLCGCSTPASLAHAHLRDTASACARGRCAASSAACHLSSLPAQQREGTQSGPRHALGCSDPDP